MDVDWLLEKYHIDIIPLHMQVRQYLESLHHFDEILETRAGGVISSHCGPGTFGVLFIAG